MREFFEIDALRNFVKSEKKQGKTIALVPTMGALHDGHISLVRLALEAADICIASIFVNPTQFDKKNDLDAYPADLEGDIGKLKTAGCNALWAPSVSTMYPSGFSCSMKAGSAAQGMEGASRAGHFDGVASVVAKLFNQAQPDVAIFGEKDWQQLSVIRQMTRDFDVPVQIIGAPIVRDEFGLAMSSRNSRLSEDGIKIARKLNVILKGENPTEAKILAAGFDKVDYIETHKGRILTAAWVEGVRLIDNMSV